MLVQVLEWIESDVFVALRLVHVFLILSIFVRITLVETLISHVLKFLSNRASRQVLILVGLSG